MGHDTNNRRPSIEVDSFLEDLLAPMGRSERRRWARTYAEAAVGWRAQIDGTDGQSPVGGRASTAAVRGAESLDGGRSATAVGAEGCGPDQFPEVWILDDTSFPKAGQHSVGVGRQYCGALGKVANCQVAVTLHWSSGEASCPLGWRLFVPQKWFEDAERAAAVKLPPDLTFRCKPELACELSDQMLGWGVPPLRAGDRFLRR